jgi:MFS transporter, UMF1 family
MSEKTSFLESVGLHRKELRSWAMYDWANSAFATTIMASLLPIYYADVAAGHLEKNIASAYWGYTTAIALLIAALISPILGATADHLGKRKKFLATFLAMGVIGTASLMLVQRGDYIFASLFFILANIGFAGSNVFYDALLPHIANDKEIDRVSTAGFAIGYLGGGLLFALNIAWIVNWEIVGFADKGMAVRAAFGSVAIWWLIFSIPLLRNVNEPKKTGGDDKINVLTVGFKKIFATAKEIRKYKQVMIFLVGYWFYTDGVGTIIKMATIYGREMGIGSTHLMGAMLMVQFLGIPFTFAFGYIANKTGIKAGLMLTLCVYTVICVLGYYMTSPIHFWLIAGLVATVQGGCQALSRSLYASMIPTEKSSEFFSFISVSGKFAGIMGPLMFGIVAQMTGGSRISILFLVTFFIIGAFMLYKLNIEEGRAAVGKNK